MRKELTTLGMCFLLILGAKAQSVVGGIQGKGLDMQTTPNGYVTGLPLAPLEREGTFYLFDDWSTGTIYLETVKISDYHFRYDIKTNQMEIQSGNVVKILDGRRIKRFEINKPEGLMIYVNAEGYTLDGSSIIGFFNLISDGTWKVLSKTETKILKSTYVSSLDAGDRKEKITKEVRYFIAQNNTLVDPKKIKKKTVHKIFKDQPESLRLKIIEANFNAKNVTDLVALAGLLNSNENIN